MSEGPNGGASLRFAVWSSGRVVFATDSAKWESPLKEGKLEPSELKALGEKLAATGVFDLPGNAYLVPDAQVLVTLVRIAGREQILYWDEVEHANYGININPQPHHLAFKKAWHDISQILEQNLPKTSQPFGGQFLPPRSWYIKEAIQSK